MRSDTRFSMSSTARHPGLVVELGERTVAADQDDGQVVPGVGVASHPGRVRGHARKSEADRVGPIVDDATNRVNRHMAFDHVALDDRSVTGRGLLGNAVLGPKRGPLGVVGQADVGAVCSQVHDPRFTTASTGVASDVDRDTVERSTIDGLGRCRRRCRAIGTLVGVSSRASGGPGDGQNNQCREYRRAPRRSTITHCGVVAGCDGRVSSCGPHLRRRRCERPVRVGTSTTERCRR
jgi:hypothetical protein